MSRSDVKARSAGLKLKKRRVQKDDAPSNRTFGNCLLEVHCSQKDRPGTRANAAFPAVAGFRQEKLYTEYQQPD
jgi:hypothetical protein